MRNSKEHLKPSFEVVWETASDEDAREALLKAFEMIFACDHTCLFASKLDKSNATEKDESK